MRKIFLKFISIFVIFFACLFLTNQTYAFEFVKSISNPLPVFYINNYTSQLQANIFKEGDIYKGIFVIYRSPETYYSLGYFESINGIDWQMKKEILNTGIELSNARILKTQTGYLLFITRYDNNSIYRIYSSSCDFDFNCSTSFSPVIVPDINNSSEKNGVFAGYPFKQDSRTYLFFGAWGDDGFKIKLAYSDDLLTWQRCPNGFLYGGDGPSPYAENSNLFLFFHRSDGSGIKMAKSALPLSCDSVFEDQGYQLIKDKIYDQRHMIFPSVINDNGGLKLYYSGLGSDSRWRLSLATVPTPTLIPTAIPTLTPTPTSIPDPTPTPTNTPTPTLIPAKMPIILIPGFLASWNRDAIIHNVNQSQSNWQLNPIVNEYTGIINTLKNLGYVENRDLFIFAYDWRKPVLDIVEDLNSFITSHESLTTNFQIIGHSLGGLVSRIYLQKYNNTNLKNLITVGSPHRGATVAYKIVEAGEIEKFNDYLWLAVKTVVTVNKNNFETDKQTLNRLIPVMRDIFPVYNFLKKDGVEINLSDMQIKNDLLSNYNSNLSNESNLSNLISIVGEKGNTLKGFNVKNQTMVDKLLGNYLDGHPESSFSEIGDNTVLSTSATINTPVTLNLEHNELIYKKEGIKKVLDLIDIQYKDSQVVEGKGTIIDSSIIFLIKSPATMEVISNGQTYQEQDGMIFIEAAQSGNYELKVKGIGSGNYQVIVGQIGKNTDVWDHIYGETNPLKTDYYNILYSNDSPESYLEASNNVSYLIEELSNYFKSKNNYLWLVTKFMKHKMSWVKRQVIKNRDFIALEKIENIEFKLLKKDHRKIKYSEVEKIEKKLGKLKSPVDQVVLAQIVSRLEKVKKEFANGNYGYCEILLESIEELLRIVKK